MNKVKIGQNSHIFTQAIRPPKPTRTVPNTRLVLRDRLRTSASTLKIFLVAECNQH